MCSGRGGAEEKGKTASWNSVSHQNWWKKLVWFQVISFCKIFILSYTFDAPIVSKKNWSFSPPNCETLLITLICLH
jgi:hypothetical protein